MKATLQPGIRYEHKFMVPASKTVPALYPEAEEFAEMPEVFATGFLVVSWNGPASRRSTPIWTGRRNKRLERTSMSAMKRQHRPALK